MGLIYRHAKLPNNPELVDRTTFAQESLHDKLAAIDVDTLDLSEYNRAYLRRYQAKLHSNLQKFAYILVWALAPVTKSLRDIVLLDYGGGAGILSLLARECGIGTVIYNDIYDVSCLDAETLGRAVSNVADGYVCGDLSDLTHHLATQSIACDVMVASDVIEHVHNVDGFLSQLSALSDHPFSIVMSTHANTLNPMLRRVLTRKQREVEYSDREYTRGHKKRDSLQSYLNIRREIIERCSDGMLPCDDVDTLARATRGMIESEIRDAVAQFAVTGELPPTPTHPTNTCDPLTGNWADRLEHPHKLANRFAVAGLKVRVLKGFYGVPNGSLKQHTGRVVDSAIRLLGADGLRLAPFFLLCATALGTRTQTAPMPKPQTAEDQHTRTLL